MELDNISAIGDMKTFPLVTIFPNPVMDILQCESNYSIDEIIIRNIAGQVMATYHPKSKSFGFDCSMLKIGTYVLSLKSNQIRHNSKIVMHQ